MISLIKKFEISKIKKANKVILALLIAIIFLSNNTFASSAVSEDFCSSMISSNGISGTNILNIAFLIMLVMFFVIALAYLLGYSFKIDKLVKFAKSEFGEIIVTGILLAIFGGFIFAVNGMTNAPQSPQLAYQNVYLIDCGNFYQTSVITITQIKGLIISQFLLQFLSSFYIVIARFSLNIAEKVGYGAFITVEPQKFTPFSGLGMISAVFITTLFNVTVGLTGLLLVVTFILGIFYAMLPFFFYLGIVFRTFPWTRAMGGSFLALFIAFYFVFPLMLFAMLIAPCGTPSSYACAQTQIAGNINLQSILNNEQNAFFSTSLSSYINNLLSGWNFNELYGDFSSIIYDIIAPASYDLFALIISLMVSYDMFEGLGDLLGAPSLSSKHALKKII